MMIYLDWAATAIPDFSLLSQALSASVEIFGNPSSIHDAGRAAKLRLEAARSGLLASFLGPAPNEPEGSLVFTGSGTEADQIPLLSLLRMAGARTSRPHIVLSSIEHAAVHTQAEVLARLGFDLGFVDPDAEGRVSPASLMAKLRPQTRLVAVMAVNNETGAIQDSASLAAALDGLGPLKRRTLCFHVDCVQALGKIPLGFLSKGIDSAAFSAHKIRGPRGVGALWTKKPIQALAQGGGQEEGMRSGTENLFGAEAFRLCAESAARDFDINHAQSLLLEKRLIDGVLRIDGGHIVPESRQPGDGRWVPCIVSLAFPGLGGEVMARALSDRGIAISTGSACSHAKHVSGRRVLDAMGVDKALSFSAIRVSTGPDTKPEQIDAFLESAEDIYKKLKN
ncbi:MAG: cysteine desulfurase family protein [Spirochaetes bacterium]|nr:cysteine desulfurase family protein [Spirochaetota bacterium]